MKRVKDVYCTNSKHFYSDFLCGRSKGNEYLPSSTDIKYVCFKYTTGTIKSLGINVQRWQVQGALQRGYEAIYKKILPQDFYDPVTILTIPPTNEEPSEKTYLYL